MFGVGVPIYARALRTALEGPAWITAFVRGAWIGGAGIAGASLGAEPLLAMKAWMPVWMDMICALTAASLATSILPVVFSTACFWQPQPKPMAST